MTKSFVSLGTQLRNCPGVLTLGLRPAFFKYTENERLMLRKADVIFFPSLRYIDLFRTIKKTTYPSPSCYLIGNNLLKQALLFKLANIPHPKTTICLSRDGIENVLFSHNFPFLGIRYKEKLRSKRVTRISDRNDLQKYLNENKICLFREFKPVHEIFKVIVMDFEVAYSYRCKWSMEKNRWKPFNVHAPREAERLMKRAARMAKLNHVIGEMAFYEKRLLLLGIDIRLPVKELIQLGFDPYSWLCKRICSGKFTGYRIEGTSCIG